MCRFFIFWVLGKCIILFYFCYGFIFCYWWGIAGVSFVDWCCWSNFFYYLISRIVTFSTTVSLADVYFITMTLTFSSIVGSLDWGWFYFLIFNGTLTFITTILSLVCIYLLYDFFSRISTISTTWSLISI